MNFLEMVLALFAIIFFTSVSLVYNRSMWNQAENLDNVAKIIQATHLAHSKLDQIDAELLSQQVAFAKRQIANTPPTVEQHYTGTVQENLTYSGYVFNLTYDHDYCDSLGSTVGVSQAYVDTTVYKFIKMTVTVASTPGMSHPVAVSRVYTKTNFYFDY
jgi:starvation-inducible outer membrane lipoprotein